MRVTWFGGKSCRVQFGQETFWFQANDPDAQVVTEEAKKAAQLIDDANRGAFIQLDGQMPSGGKARLIDAVDQETQYLFKGTSYILDEPHVERLVLLSKEDLSLIPSDWFDNAVVALVGSGVQVCALLEKLQNLGVRQVVAAISDLDQLDFSELTRATGRLKLQLLEQGYSIEL